MNTRRFLLLVLALACATAFAAYAYRVAEQGKFAEKSKFEEGTYSATSNPNMPDGTVDFAAATFRFLYVIGYGIAGYHIDPGGELRGMKIANSGDIGCRTDAAAADRSGEWLYLGCTRVWGGKESATSLLPCKILPTGWIKPQGALRVALPSKPVSMTIDRSGKYLYAGTEGGLYQYALGADGKARPLDPFKAPGQCGMAALAFSPNGRYAYATNFARGRLFQFRVGAGGKLDALNPASIDAGPGPMETRVDPHGRFVWCLDGIGESVARFEVGEDGTLRRLSPAIDNLGYQSTSLAITPDGRHAYVARYRYNSVLQFQIQPDGSFTHASPYSAPGSGSPSVIRVDPEGRYAFALNVQHALMSLYAVNEHGTLDPAKPSNILCPGWPLDMVFVGQRPASRKK